MATKKDLVEAHAFSRRRLVTAFVSGAPGGREVEPTRPMRAVIGGVAICVLLLAGAAIAGVFAPRTEDNWLEPNNLIVSKEKGTLYLVVSEGDSVSLRPFANATSAQLLLGEKDPSRAAQDEIDKQTIGTEIGILGAPSSIPPASDLIQSGWTACTSTGRGILTRIASEPGGTEVGNGAKIVQDPDGERYLIAYASVDFNDDPQAVRFKLPADNADALLGGLDLGQVTDAVTVDRKWLNLFDQSDTLDVSSFQLPGRGGRIDYSAEVGLGDQIADLRVGDLIGFDGETYLLTQGGPAALTPFALAVYAAATAEPVNPVEGRPGKLVEPDEVWPSRWPQTVPELVPGDACAMLVPRDEQAATVRLVRRDNVADASPEGVNSGSNAQLVEPGHGALVKAGGFGDAQGTVDYLIDARGRAFRIEGDTTLEHLGFLEVPSPTIPDAWLNLFRPAPSALSAEAAGRPPVDPGGGDPQ